MFVPVAFFATLACRRPLWVATIGVLAPVAVELTQSISGAGRTCYGYDWVNNATGALLGVLGAAVLLALAPLARRRGLLGGVEPG